MSKIAYYSDYPGLPEAILGFGNLARINGLNAGVAETLDIVHCAQQGLIQSKDQFYFALKAIYCCQKEDISLFDDLFDWFWRKEKPTAKGKTTFKNQSNLQKKSPGSIVLLGEGKQEPTNEESQSVSGANAIERIRKTDFSKLSHIESQLLEDIAEKLWRQMSLRLKRKLKNATQKGKIDIRQTIRKNISKGGTLIDLKRKRKQLTKQRLVVLLDVSGSMDKYSFFLLKFLFALRSHFEKIDLLYLVHICLE